jgi:2-amino-4-hydroxy-6-hydroxymethyldihydropteridine diphosphokinase
VSAITVIGLGANLGDRRGTIEAAIAAIAALPTVRIEARSSVWRTTAIGGPVRGPWQGLAQPDFFNAALAVHSLLPPEELMRELLAIEARLGRVRSERNAPRIIDLDLLWREGTAVRIQRAGAPVVELPHPRLHERPFAMAPLLEVVPNATDPVSGKPYAVILTELGMAGVTPLDSSEA